MTRQGLRSAVVKKYNHQANKGAIPDDKENLLKQDFHAETVNQKRINLRDMPANKAGGSGSLRSVIYTNGFAAAALLLCENKNADEIVRLSREKNIYQLDGENRRRDAPLRMIKGLQTINQPLLEVIVHGRDDEAGLISFLALRDEVCDEMPST